MDEIVHNYTLGKYTKCINLLKSLPETEDFVENFIQENCRLICESMVKIYKNTADEILENQELLYLFWNKVMSADLVTNQIPLQLKLTSTINFLFWLLFHNDYELSQEEVECYIELLANILYRVLGKKETIIKTSDCSEFLDCLYSFKSLMHNQDNKTILLIMELITIVLLYVCKLKRTLLKNCLQVLNSFTKELNEISKFKEMLNKFLGIENNSLCLFKFGLVKQTTTVSELDESVLHYVYLLESGLLYLVGDFRGSLKSLQNNFKCMNKSIWNYLGVLNCYELENWDLCLGFLFKGLEMPMEGQLKARYYVMKGKLECVRRNHKEAVKCFEEALVLCPNFPIVYYLLGQEYARMGLTDFMMENFEKLIQILEDYKCEYRHCPNFESIILRFLHCSNEISETEALYALSAAYGLNERFQKAAKTFEKLLKLIDLDKPTKVTMVHLPNHLTILHEASVINLLTGNLVRAEQLSFDAMERYTPQELAKKPNTTPINWNKDIGWLRKIIQQELLEGDLEPKELQKETHYTEEVFFIFQQNIIALLIQSEIQRIQEVEEHKATLNKILSTFSSYLASMCKKKEISDEENYVWTLVKALAGKTCLRIVAALENKKENSNVEKMYKRALSCNKGDKDALFGYYKFLCDSGRNKEALKLWKTFYKEETTVSVDEVQSTALRYFLISKVSRREIDKVQAEIELRKFDLR